MQKDNNDEQKIVPAPIKFVHNFLQGVSHVEKRTSKQHVKFLKEALVDLLDHDAFESMSFREKFAGAITYFEIQSSFYEGYSESEINQGVNFAIKAIENEVNNA
jgi:hypothetical protein